jgi:DNA mismatch endonuclease (patch repair protein)
MADWLSREQRSRNMASIRSKGNATTERAFLRLLREAQISGWRRHVKLPGKPDFVFRSQRLAVFVDGCFWHGCPRCYRLPEDNRPYWKAKVLSNRRRDHRRVRELRRLQWRVLRLWEHSLKSPAGRARILSKLTKVLAAKLVRAQTQTLSRSL